MAGKITKDMEAFIIEQKNAGKTLYEMALAINGRFFIEISPSTLSRWFKKYYGFDEYENLNPSNAVRANYEYLNGPGSADQGVVDSLEAIDSVLKVGKNMMDALNKKYEDYGDEEKSRILSYYRIYKDASGPIVQAAACKAKLLAEDPGDKDDDWSVED
ncbi:hypothetical protein [Methanococcus maripaludis]|uniref:Uncharacterized protein n=1 Tax=Methanococcus maripaludis TaxID=39152 RepID=A0A7J9S5C2_METMI|nr:hypothetical protein [Methanococcus maripaludis]MBB6067882.1 hypothetical protein [Methanococcus maripaludis]